MNLPRGDMLQIVRRRASVHRPNSGGRGSWLLGLEMAESRSVKIELVRRRDRPSSQGHLRVAFGCQQAEASVDSITLQGLQGAR